MQKILIATEGSPEAREAVEYGLQLAEEQGATMPETILVAYGTKHGSTREVAETVAASIARCGLEVETRPAGQVGDLCCSEASLSAVRSTWAAGIPRRPGSSSVIAECSPACRSQSSAWARAR